MAHTDGQLTDLDRPGLASGATSEPGARKETFETRTQPRSGAHGTAARAILAIDSSYNFNAQPNRLRAETGWFESIMSPLE